MRQRKLGEPLPPGTKVSHKHIPAVEGIITCCINLDEPDDIKIQGRRYYVEVQTGPKQGTWSISEDRLVSAGDAA